MNTWFRYFLAKAISQRRGRFILSSAAVTLSVSVVTALATVSLGVREKIGAELKQYGANMIVTHQEGAPIGQDTAAAVRALSRPSRTRPSSCTARQPSGSSRWRSSAPRPGR